MNTELVSSKQVLEVLKRQMYMCPIEGKMCLRNAERAIVLNYIDTRVLSELQGRVGKRVLRTSAD